MLSHNNFLANTVNLVTCWRITASDRYLAVLPLFHVHGLANGLMTWLASGCRMRLVERFDAQRAADWFVTFQPTLFFGVPTVYVRLLELPRELAFGDRREDAAVRQRLGAAAASRLRRVPQRASAMRSSSATG